eukprot:6197020-Pleurochrysis_carterae.AAC.3
MGMPVIAAEWRSLCGSQCRCNAVQAVIGAPARTALARCERASISCRSAGGRTLPSLHTSVCTRHRSWLRLGAPAGGKIRQQDGRGEKPLRRIDVASNKADESGRLRPGCKGATQALGHAPA